MALLSADRPSLPDLLDTYGIEMLWQPSLSVESTRPYDALLEDIIDGRQQLDILCVEGSIITAPEGTGMFDQLRRRAKKDWLLALAEKARYVVAMGTCAAFGGVHSAPPNPSDCVGLQMDKEMPGGLLPVEWRSGAGFPVINIAGCPAHPNTMTKTLAMIASGIILQLDHLNRPKEFFSTLVHQGCTRNEYHEYDVEESEFGTNGCMFFNLGCKGPFTQATCNTELWNGRSSKTRAGVPCFGCTSPGFPEDEAFSRQKNSARYRSNCRSVSSAPTTLPIKILPSRCAGAGEKTEDGALMARKTLNIDLNRVEGDLEFELDVEDGRVVDARCIGVMYRGFEQIMIGRTPRDAAVITPRVCGICGTAHLYAATLALEQIWQVEVPPNAARIRNLCLLAESIQNDIRQSFLMFLVDFCHSAYRSHPLFEEIMAAFEPFKGRHHLGALEQSRDAVGIVALFGGQWPHSSYMLPGGVVGKPSQRKLIDALDIISRLQRWYEHAVIGEDLETWLAEDSFDA